MIGRKLVMLQNGQLQIQENGSFEIPYLKEAKHLTIKSVKDYKHLILVEVVKFYVQFSNLLKSGYQKLKVRVQNIHIKQHRNGEISERAEVSKVVKFISGYTHRIKEIKKSVTEEEKNL